jgi:hypothetical protein
MSPEEFFGGGPFGFGVYRKIEDILSSLGTFEVRVTKSQVAFRRKRAFAFLWMPGKWLAKPSAEVVLSFALGREDGSPRFKEVVHPAPGLWMHHLEVLALDALDEEVIDWMREAADHAS